MGLLQVVERNFFFAEIHKINRVLKPFKDYLSNSLNLLNNLYRKTIPFVSLCKRACFAQQKSLFYTAI